MTTRRRDEEHLAGVHWSKTRAFAIGLAGIFINLKDKYDQGIVDPGNEADRLRKEIAGRLEALVDPTTGESAVKRVYIAGQFYRGPYKDNAPDLIVGYRRGYRVSWEAAIGKTTEPSSSPIPRHGAATTASTRRWSPASCSATARSPTENPRLIDVAPTVLSLFGVDVPDYMDGKAMTVGDLAEKPAASAKTPWPRSPDERCIIRPEGDPKDPADGHGRRGRRRRRPGRGQLLARRPQESRASPGKKVIVIGIDGMDPRLSERMMQEGLLPNLEKLRAGGGFSTLGTSTPPQSPVAWANFINGAGPGDHGIFDFIHRHPEDQCIPFYSAAETIPGEGSWDVGDHRIPLDFWPINHKPPRPC